jgi:beta-glucanase (GH16 family)
MNAILTGTATVLFAAFVVGAPVGSSSAAVAKNGATTTTPPPNCQDTNPLGMPGNWSCTFDDEFNGSSLDTSVWVPQLTASSGFIAGPDCYVDTPQTISVSGGYLNLSVVPDPNFKCVGKYTSNYLAGMVSTTGKFTQTYGAFEVNAKLPAATVGGLQETFWLYHQTNNYGPGAASGEIDFAEFYSAYPTLDIPAIHYSKSSTDPNATTYKCAITPNQFNTYGVDWTPTSITILYNGQVCLVDHPTTGSVPFDKPFFIALTQALGLVGVNALTAKTPLPATTQVDWVRAWAPAS